MPDGVLIHAHIGDLHLTTEDQENYRDLDAIVTEIAGGSDADVVDAWEARGVLGTQLGPNRNGRKW